MRHLESRLYRYQKQTQKKPPSYVLSFQKLHINLNPAPAGCHHHSLAHPGNHAESHPSTPGQSTPLRSEADRRGSPGSEENRRRSEEHTSELQSRGHLVCRLLLEKKKDTKTKK